MEKESSVQALKGSHKDYQSYKVSVKDKTNNLVSELEIAWTPRSENVMMLFLVLVLLLLLKSLMKKTTTPSVRGIQYISSTGGQIDYTYTYKK